MKSSSARNIAVGGGLIGAYILYKAIFPSVKDSADVGEGILGGTEDELLAQQGFDIDPNVRYEEKEINPYLQLIEPVIAGDITDPTSITPTISKDIPIYDVPDVRDINKQFSYLQDVSAEDTLQLATEQEGLLGSGITLPQFGLGAVGLGGSYFTEFGGKMFKKSVPAGDAFLKSIQKSALESTPIIGKKVAGVATKKIVTKGGMGILKRFGKTGISMIPLVGTVAGAEFDVSLRDKPRYEAYPAAVVGDILGGVGGFFASPSVVGGVAAGVGGQIAGEEAVYGMFKGIRKFFGIEDKKERISYTPSKISDLSISPLHPSVESQLKPVVSKTTDIKTSGIAVQKILEGAPSTAPRVSTSKTKVISDVRSAEGRVVKKIIRGVEHTFTTKKPKSKPKKTPKPKAKPKKAPKVVTKTIRGVKHTFTTKY